MMQSFSLQSSTINFRTIPLTELWCVCPCFPLLTGILVCWGLGRAYWRKAFVLSLASYAFPFLISAWWFLVYEADGWIWLSWLVSMFLPLKNCCLYRCTAIPASIFSMSFSFPLTVRSAYRRPARLQGGFRNISKSRGMNLWSDPGFGDLILLESFTDPGLSAKRHGTGSWAGLRTVSYQLRKINIHLIIQ